MSDPENLSVDSSKSSHGDLVLWQVTWGDRVHKMIKFFDRALAYRGRHTKNYTGVHRQTNAQMDSQKFQLVDTCMAKNPKLFIVCVLTGLNFRHKNQFSQIIC